MLNIPPLKTIPLSPRRQLFYLFLICIGCLLVGGLGVGSLISAIYKFDILEEMVGKGRHPAGYLSAFRWFIGLGNTVVGFLMPALIFAFFTVRQPDAYLRYRNQFPLLLLGAVLAFMIFFLPVVQVTSYFNQHVSFPPALKGLERMIRNSEAANEAMLKQVMVMKSPGDIAISLFLVALLPAIAEEFLFRGCLQTIFRRWGMGVHAAVWTAAAIFSFIHFEFLGFVPRMVLGAALGYFFAYSGSIWPAVLGHFLNNASAVIAYYLYQNHKIAGDPDNAVPTTGELWYSVLSFAIAMLIMRFYQRYATKKRLEYGEALD